jgi:predicted Zn-dependent peptidase
MLGCAAVLPKFRVDKGLLDNGLRVVTISLPHLHSATLVMYAKVGSRYETPADNGLSHFLEHMLFRGTKRHPSSYQLNYAIEELGGTLHAETGRDYSLYQIGLLPELVGEGVEIFGELLGAPKLQQIDLERQIILEEISEDMDERGRDLNLDDRTRAAMFPEHGLGQKITGPRDNVRRFSAADVRRHLKRFYGAKNLVFCVSGRVEHKKVMAAAKRALSSLPAGRAAHTEPPEELGGGPHHLYVESPGAQTQLAILFRALPEADPDYMALQMLSRVLDDGMSTRLHYTLCDQKGLAYYVQGGIEPFHDTALFEVQGAASHAKFAQLAEEALVLLDGFRQEKVAPKELEKARRRYRADLMAMFDEPDSMAGWFGGTELFYPPQSFATRAARMDAVTADDVLRVAQKVIRRERLVVGAAGALTKTQRARFEKVIEKWS